MDEEDNIKRLRADLNKVARAVVAMQKESKEAKRRPAQQFDQMQAVATALTRMAIAIGVDDRVARRWQEALIGGADADRMRMANLEMFDAIGRLGELPWLLPDDPRLREGL